MKVKLSVLLAVAAAALYLATGATAAATPSVATTGASGVAATSAILHAKVNPQGAATTYYIQWGLTTSYGVNGPTQSAGAGTKTISVATLATGLTPGTVYHFRVVAASVFGIAVGQDRTFHTSGHPPAGVTTGPTTGLGKFTATLTGVVNPNGEATAWAFQYGLTSAYSAQTFGGALPATSATITVTQPLAGLQPGTVFHYRLIALHGSAVVSYGADETFMTLPFPRPRPTLRIALTPRTDRHHPYSFTVFGSVVSSRFSAALECTGGARVSYFNGRTRVASQIALLQPNCTFSTHTTFDHTFARRGHARPASQRLSVRVEFLGNGYLTPRTVGAGTVTLG